MPRFPQKFTGAKARLFATGCAQYSYCAESDCNENPKEHPLFVRLSLNQRLKLISEVAVGLLCPKEPLPPETLEHYAAYLGVVACIRIELEIEMDDVDDTEMGADFFQEYYVKRRSSSNSSTPTATPQRTAEEMAEWASERALLQKAARKQKRKLDKTLANETGDKDDGEEKIKFEAQPAEFDYEKWLQGSGEKLKLLFEGGPCTDREPIRPLTESEKDTFRWRLLADAAFLEDVTPCLCRAPLANVNFCWHCYEAKKWFEAIHLLFVRITDMLDISLEDHALLWGEITASTYADPKQHARIREVERVAKQLREPYEASWDSNQKAEDQRLIFALCDAKRRFGHGHGPFVKEFERQCGVRGFQLNTKDKYQERLEIYRSMKDTFKQGLDRGFMHGNDGLGTLDNPRAYKFEDVMNLKMCSNPRHYEHMWEDFRTTGRGGFGSDEDKLMKCARCRVVQYCSKRCQKEDWKAHKKHCGSLALWKKDQDKISEVAEKH